MHEDSAASDVSVEEGPQGRNARWEYHEYGNVAGMCPTFVFDSRQRALTVGFKCGQSELLLLEASTLTRPDSPVRITCATDLPPRLGPLRMARQFLADPEQLFKDTSGGVYLFVDHRDRVVVPTANRDLRVFALEESSGKPEFRLLETISVQRRSGARELIPEDDKLTATLPEWNSEGVYWFTSRKGIVGLADSRTGQAMALNIRQHPEAAADEEIQNSFAVGPDGAFVVSDYALYRLESRSGRPVIVDRSHSYERGRAKIGQIGPGSGTTPTLLGRFVAIGDNANPMNINIYRRSKLSELAGQQPVFTARGSACENSFIHHRGALVVCNTYGYISPFSDNSRSEAGLWRVDVHPYSGRCSVRWRRDDLNIVSTTPKLSASNGTIYAYTQTLVDGELWWAVLGISFETGETKLTIPISRPVHERLPGGRLSPRAPEEFDKFDNGWGPIFIGLNRWGVRSLFVGMIKGFLLVRER